MPDLLLHQPHSLDEACATLARYDGEARAIAGGTALVLMLRQGLLAPPALVRLDTIPGLDAIAEVDGMLRLGALATLSAVAASPLVRARVPVLAAACALVGNVRVRNAATLGGNLCEADYASDPPGVLVALDARVSIHGPRGVRELPVAALVRDFYETALAPDELVTEVRVPLPAPTGVYLKYVTRSAEDRPCVGVTALVRRAAEGQLAEARVAVGAVAGRPLRLPAAEALARGAAPDEALFRAIGEAYAAAVEPVSDARGSAAYRRQMVAVFVRRALRAAAAGHQGAWRV